MDKTPEIPSSTKMPSEVRDFFNKQLANQERWEVKFNHGIEDAMLP